MKATTMIIRTTVEMMTANMIGVVFTSFVLTFKPSSVFTNAGFSVVAALPEDVVRASSVDVAAGWLDDGPLVVTVTDWLGEPTVGVVVLVVVVVLVDGGAWDSVWVV